MILVGSLIVASFLYHFSIPCIPTPPNSPSPPAAKAPSRSQEIAEENELHPVQVSQWKKELLDGAHTVFGNPNRDSKREAEAAEKREARLERKVGQLTIELEWLQKKSKELGL